MKHYVILCDVAVENMGVHETHVTAVTHSLEDAKRILAERAADEREYAYEHDWAIYTDTDEEFDAGEDGNSDVEHVHFYIEEAE